MKLVSMARTAKDKKAQQESYKVGPVSESDYPYGLTLRLDKDALSKLGITELPDAGALMNVVAKAKVVSVNESASEHNESRSVELQITELACEPDKSLADEDMSGYAKRRGKVR